MLNCCFEVRMKIGIGIGKQSKENSKLKRHINAKAFICSKRH